MAYVHEFFQVGDVFRFMRDGQERLFEVTEVRDDNCISVRALHPYEWPELVRVAADGSLRNIHDYSFWDPAVFRRDRKCTYRCSQ